MNKIFLASTLLVSLFATATQAATVEAYAVATVQAGGPRTGSSGTNYFNIEGSNNGSFASYGVARFNLGAMKSNFDAQYGVGGWVVDSVVLELVQSNASFTANGNVGIYFSQDDAVSIANTGGSPLAYPFGGDFPDAELISSFAFAKVATGTLENHTLYTTGGANSCR